MRAKYKLGQFIQTKAKGDELPTTGVIEAVVLRKEGASYQLIGNDEEVLEGDVAAVFRPVTPRASKPRAEKAEKKLKKAA